ncbi:site-specific integrase [Sorangium sp. So ce1078]|uniref:site-specific integrase n=1 Tax=Sorangium sp. So ce1078 TaxID=3133329 RepID=UPI003F63C200
MFACSHEFALTQPGRGRFARTPDGRHGGIGARKTGGRRRSPTNWAFAPGTAPAESAAMPRTPEAPTARPPRLLERVREAIRTRRYSPRTEEAYCAWIRRFILFHDRRHPRDLGLAHVEAFLTHLATDQHVSASTQNQALAAILFSIPTSSRSPSRSTSISPERSAPHVCPRCSRRPR